MVDAGDTDQVKKSQKVAKKAKAKEELKYKAILDTYEGRELVWDILSEAKVYGSSYVKDDNGGRATAFNEGRRHIGLWLMDNIFTLYPTIYNVMQQEAERRDYDKGKEDG